MIQAQDAEIQALRDRYRLNVDDVFAETDSTRKPLPRITESLDERRRKFDAEVEAVREKHAPAIAEAIKTANAAALKFGDFKERHGE